MNSQTLIDDRFKEVLTDKKFKMTQKIDKYGRKVEIQNVINEEMQKFYYVDEEKLIINEK